MTKKDSSSINQLGKLRQRFEKLNNQKIRADEQRRLAESQLAQFREEALEKWGTDQLEILEQKLERMKRDNEAASMEYERHLDEIDAALQDIEELHSSKAQ